MLSAKRTVTEVVVDPVPRRWWWPFGAKGGVQKYARYEVRDENGQGGGVYTYRLEQDPGPQMFCARMCMDTGEMVFLDNRG